MNIYAKYGTKVKYLDENGYDSDIEHARKFLKKGQILTVDSTNVGGSYTTVYFVETGAKGFNSVMFEDIKEPTKRSGGMNRKKFLKELESFISVHNENPDLTLEKAAEILLDEVERLGMVPVSKYRGFMTGCVINDWEENLTDDEICREMHRQTDRD